LALCLRVETEVGVSIAEKAMRVGAFGHGIHKGAEVGQEGMELVMIAARRRERRPRFRER
jgi:hypothetical protein